MKLNCADIEERIAAYLVDDLTVQERFWIEMHLRDCAECRTEIDTLADIAGSLQADFETEADLELDPGRRATLSAQFAKANPDFDLATRRRWRRVRAMAANMSVAAALLLGAYLGFVSGNQRVQPQVSPEVTLEIASLNFAASAANTERVEVVSGPVSGVPYPDLIALSKYYYVPEYGNGSNITFATSYAGLPVPRLASDPAQAFSYSE